MDDGCEKTGVARWMMKASVMDDGYKKV